MTGRGRSADAQARGAQALSERTLFAPGKPGDALPEAVPGARPASPSSEKPASPEPLRPPDVGIVGRLVRRIISWSPDPVFPQIGPDPVAFSERAATALLLRKDMAWALNQIAEYLTSETAFTQRSATG